MPTIDLLQQRGPTVYYLDTGVAVFRSLVNPEGAIEAKKDSLCLYDGGVYVKSTDTGNTGWVSVGSDAGSLIYPLAQWTQRSSGGGVGAGFTDQTGSILINAGRANNVNLSGLTRPPVGASFTVTAKLRTMMGRNGSASTGIWAYNSLNNRSIMASMLIDFSDIGGSPRWGLQRMTNLSTFSANIISPMNCQFHRDLYWRMTSNGTVLTFSVSNDGMNFVTLGQETIATFLTAAGGSLDGVGVVANPASAGFARDALHVAGLDRGLMKTRTRCGLCRYDYDAARSRSSRFCNRCLKKFGPRSGKAKHHPVSKLLRAWR